MASGMSDFLKLGFLNQLFNNTAIAFTTGGGEPTNIYAKLHKDASGGANGTANASSVTTRQSLSFGSAASGTIANDVAVTWTSWAGTDGEIVYGISIWDDSSAGNCLGFIDFSATKTMATGGTLTIPIGSLTLTGV